MSDSSCRYFISYSRTDTDRAVKLAERLRAVDVSLWIDQFDIEAGARWDNAIEEALEVCQGLIVLLSEASVASENVLDEVSYALGGKKKVIPVLLEPCDMPFRLRRLQYIDLFTNYDRGIDRLVRDINSPEQKVNKFIRQHQSSSLSQAKSSTFLDIDQPELSASLPRASVTSMAPEKQSIYPTQSFLSGRESSSSQPKVSVKNRSVKTRTEENVSVPVSAKKNTTISPTLVNVSIACICVLAGIVFSGRFSFFSFLNDAFQRNSLSEEMTEIEYSPAPGDSQKIRRVLSNRAISNKFNVQIERNNTGDRLTDTIRAGSDVADKEIRMLARALIKEGVDVRVIEQRTDWIEAHNEKLIHLGFQSKNPRCTEGWTEKQLNEISTFAKVDQRSGENPSLGCTAGL
ncbi:MAG: toll/interleukin-1 receptor domain-containing protein [Cyanobacteria bacterium P01_F01_bin.53]